jgi:hypothetical protein
MAQIKIPSDQNPLRSKSPQIKIPSDHRTGQKDLVHESNANFTRMIQESCIKESYSRRIIHQSHNNITPIIQEAYNNSREFDTNRAKILHQSYTTIQPFFHLCLGRAVAWEICIVHECFCDNVVTTPFCLFEA